MRIDLLLAVVGMLGVMVAAMSSALRRLPLSKPLLGLWLLHVDGVLAVFVGGLTFNAVGTGAERTSEGETAAAGCSLFVRASSRAGHSGEDDRGSWL
jgi:hypothetical protein